MRKEVLDANHNLAITLLAAGYTNMQVAEKTGVSHKTISNWKKRNDFHALLKRATAACYEASLAELVAGSRRAARELTRIVDDPDTPPRVKVSAIQVLLSNAAKVKESLLEDRLETLEAMMDEEDDDYES